MKLEQKPNVIFILSDTHRYDAMSFTNPLKDHFKIHTPNLEKMAQQGVSFENCYTNLPICSPARSIYQIGRWPFQWGGIANHMDLGDRIDETSNENKTLGYLFKNAGYATAHVGKWHQGLKNNAQNAGYDNSYIWPNEQHDSMVYSHNGDSETEFDNEDILGNSTDLKYSGTPEDPSQSIPSYEKHPYKIIGQTDQTLALLQQHSFDDKPLFLTLCMQDPHGPFKGTAKAPSWGDYSHRSQYPDLYENDENHPPHTLAKYRAFLDAPTYRPYDELKDSLDDYHYYSSIAVLDDQIGRVMDWVDSQAPEIRDNTIIIYSSDHGAMGGAQKVPGGQKRWPHDPSTRIPFIVRWPNGIENTGRSADELISFMDFLPTFSHLAGLEKALENEGSAESLESLNYLKESPGVNHSQNITKPSGGPDPQSIFLFHYSNMNSISSPCPVHRTVITKDWVFSKKGRTRQGGKPNWTDWDSEGGWLYDRKNDPFQLNNLFDSTNYKDVHEEHHGILRKWMEDAELPYRPRWFAKTTLKNIKAWSLECGIESDVEEEMREQGEAYVMNV